MEKAGHKTRKRLELYEANLKGVTFTLSWAQEGSVQALGVALPLLTCRRTDLDAHAESSEG